MTAWVFNIDAYVLHALYSVRVLDVSYVFIGFSEMGSVLNVLGLTACVSLFLAIKGKYADIAGLLFVVGGSGATTYLLKHLIHRARPETFYRAYPESGFSFPSGHATDAVALYGFIAFLIIRLAPRQYRRAGALVCSFLVLMIGFSRLYLGVHYLSDVLGGFAVGLIFVYFGTLVVRFVENYLKRRQVVS